MGLGEIFLVILFASLYVMYEDQAAENQKTREEVKEREKRDELERIETKKEKVRVFQRMKRMEAERRKAEADLDT